MLLQNYDNIDFQGLAPIVRDFYVFIPSWLWPGRPSMVLNSANYFTWEVLNNHSGLAISPKDLLTAYKFGVKTLYYQNTRDGAEDAQDDLVPSIQDDGCESGACKI